MSELEDHLRAQDDSFGRFFWHRLRWRAVSAYLPDDGAFNLLDVGAGGGHFGTFLSERFPRAHYFFVEPLPSLEMQLADRFGPARNAAELLDFSEMEYVTLLDVVEHQEDDAAFLRSVVEKCRPGTTLILTVPALMQLWSNWDVALGHFRRYDRPSLTSLLEQLPAEILEVSYLFPGLVLPGLVRTWRSRRRPMNGGSGEETFPQLPGVVNELLSWFGIPGVTWRRRLPFGSSLFAVIKIVAP